jgi:phenylacetate-coenzyme A ligase PaaK-like adenylate-forming protein
MSDLISDLKCLLTQPGPPSGPAPTAEEIAEYRVEFLLSQLQETLKYAASRVPYYAREWSRLGIDPGDVQCLSDIAVLPIIRKADLIANREALVSTSARVTGFRCSSGTTGPRLPFPITREDVEAINLFGEVRAHANAHNAPAPIILRIVPPVRRLAADVGGGGRGLMLTTFLNFDGADERLAFDYYDHIMQCLLEDYSHYGSTGKVSVLWTVPPFMIRTVTDGLLRRRFDTAGTGIRSIVTSGGIVTLGDRDYVRRHWSAELVPFYSMSEIAGSHRMCGQSELYHFDLFALPEVLDVTTQRHVSPGQAGVLVLTSLLPFQSAQPMIRYWTGDVFTYSDAPCGCGFVGASGRFHGREHECVYLSSLAPATASPSFLGPADIIPLLERHSIVPRWYKHPKFRLSSKTAHGQRIISLEVETYPARREELELTREMITADLTAAIGLDAGRQSELDVEVRLVLKGSLPSECSAYPDR